MQLRSSWAIEEEKLRILNDEAVAKKFDIFNSKLKNKELQAFRDYITDNKHLLPMLNDPEGLKRDLWMQYLRAAHDEYKALVSEYRVGQIQRAAATFRKILLRQNTYADLPRNATHRCG